MSESNGIPMDVDAEQAVLGAMLIEPGAAKRGLALLEPADFCPEVTRTIFIAMRDVAARGEPVDIVTVAAELRRIGKLEAMGGGVYLAALPTKTPTAAHIVKHAAVVRERARQRKLMSLGDRLSTAAQAGEDTATLIAEWREQIIQLAEGTEDGRGAAHLETVTDEFLHWHAAEIEKPRKVVGARLGIQSIDEALGGLAGIDGFVCYKGFSGFGKSKLLRQAAIETAKHAGPVLVYLLEGHPLKWLQDCVGYLSGLPEEKLERGAGKLLSPSEERRLIAAWSELPTLPIYITARMPIVRDVYADAIGLYRKLSPKTPPAAVIVDYLQVMQGKPGESLVETVVSACNMLRDLNAETGMPILTASQITARDGRHAPAWGTIIENTASLLFDIQRGDIRDNKLRNDPDLARLRSECTLIPVKQRHGGRRLTTTELGVQWSAGRFRDLSDSGGSALWI